MSLTRNDKTSKIFFGWKCSGLYNINDLWIHYPKVCSSENINMTTDYLFLNWHEATRGIGDGGGDGMGVCIRLLSFGLTVMNTVSQIYVHLSVQYI